jgi:hypothetical protein
MLLSLQAFIKADVLVICAKAAEKEKTQTHKADNAVFILHCLINAKKTTAHRVKIIFFIIFSLFIIFSNVFEILRQYARRA